MLCIKQTVNMFRLLLRIKILFLCAYLWEKLHCLYRYKKKPSLSETTVRSVFSIEQFFEKK